MHVRVSRNGHTIIALVDTGSARTIVSRRTWRRTKSSGDILNATTESLVAFGQTKVPLLGRWNVQFQINSEVFVSNVSVADDRVALSEMLIGRDVLAGVNINIDADGLVSLEKKIVCLGGVETRKESGVVSSGDACLGGRKTCSPTTVVGSENGPDNGLCMDSENVKMATVIGSVEPVNGLCVNHVRQGGQKSQKNDSVVDAQCVRDECVSAQSGRVREFVSELPRCSIPFELSAEKVSSLQVRHEERSIQEKTVPKSPSSNSTIEAGAAVQTHEDECNQIESIDDEEVLVSTKVSGDNPATGWIGPSMTGTSDADDSALGDDDEALSSCVAWVAHTYAEGEASSEASCRAGTGADSGQVYRETSCAGGAGLVDYPAGAYDDPGDEAGSGARRAGSGAGGGAGCCVGGVNYPAGAIGDWTTRTLFISEGVVWNKCCVNCV